MVNEFKVGDEVEHDIHGIGFVKGVFCGVNTFFSVDLNSGSKLFCKEDRLISKKQLSHHFKIGDKVAHDERGNGVITALDMDSSLDLTHFVELDDGDFLWTSSSSLRPRNFLAKIAEEQEIKGEVEMPLVSAPPMGPQWATVDQQFNKVFITDAYGIKRDPVTLLEIESDGLVKIGSIRDSVRGIT